MKDTFILNRAFCCPGLQNSIQAAGQRGMAIIVVNTLGKTRLLFQSRGIAFDDLGKMRPMPDAPDVKINVSSEIGLQYCPWCGKRLEKLLNASPEVFAGLAERHKPLYNGP